MDGMDGWMDGWNGWNGWWYYFVIIIRFMLDTLTPRSTPTPTFYNPNSLTSGNMPATR